jgi:hypothetical protein
VLKKEIPYLKIRKVIRFRPAEIEEWAEKGGIPAAAKRGRSLEGDLFAGVDNLPAGDGDNGKTETGADEQAGGTCCPPVVDN